jgi:ABC-type nitrate/sulfonate/bicarbonate transport system substrate-binding protein
MLRALWCTILLILSLWPATLVAQERYLVSYNGFGVGAAPVWATKDFGLFAKYGLNPDLVMISGSAPGIQALLGGSTHFAQTDGTALIATSMSTKGCSTSWKERAYFKGSAERAKEPSAG